MRKWAILLLMAVTAWPAMAAKSLSVDQFDQMLGVEQGKSDERVADKISDVVLTERVTAARLARWEKEFPGSHMHEALMKLSDEAAFLPPPAEDVLRDPPPDSDEQEKMLELAVEYVKTIINELPNFYATRETRRFEDTPSQQSIYASSLNAMGSAARAVRVPGFTTTRTEARPLESAGITSETVTYRDGHEVNDAEKGKGKKEDRPTSGLTSSGEFGPILGVVLSDALRSHVEWARWEQGQSDPVSVFSYAVPAKQSHYTVGIPDGANFEETLPAYHGEFAIDPATGTILWLNLAADMAPPHERLQTAIAVEYAPVEIGDRTYYCPVHSVAISKMPAGSQNVQAENSGTMVTRLNDVVFKQYHLFRSEARIVVDGSGSKADANAAATPANSAGPGGAAQPAVSTGAKQGHGP